MYIFPRSKHCGKNCIAFWGRANSKIARKRRHLSWLGGAMTDAFERCNSHRCGGSCHRWIAAGLFAIFVFLLQLFSERFTGAVALVLLAYFVFYFVMSLGRKDLQSLEAESPSEGVEKPCGQPIFPCFSGERIHFHFHQFYGSFRRS